MVFKKRKFSRGRFRRRGRGGFRRKRFSKFIKRTVRGMSEIKWSTFATAQSTDTAGAAIINITPSIAVGASKNVRIGNRIKYRRLTVHYALDLTALTGVRNALMVRAILVQPRGAFSTVPVLSDIFDTSTNWQSTINGTNCRVMYDKMQSVNTDLLNGATAAQVGGDKSFMCRKMVFKLGNNVTYRDNSVLIPTDVKDQYYLFFVTSNLNLLVGQYTLDQQIYVRMSFTDL